MTDESIPDYVLVICRRCGTRMHPDVREHAYEVKCHDCYTMAPVPSRAEVIAKFPQSNRQKPDVGTYSLSLPPDIRESLETTRYGAPEPPGEPSLPSSRTLREESAPEEITFSEYGSFEDDTPAKPESTPEPDRSGYVVRCPACDTPFAPTLINQPQVVLCPECLEDVPVPAKDDVPDQKQTAKDKVSRKTTPRKSSPSLPPKKTRAVPAADDVFDAEEIPYETKEPKSRTKTSRPGGRKKKRKRREHRDYEERDGGNNPTVNREAVGRVFDRMAEIRTVGEAPPPRWTFFTGTLNFPWRADTWFRWTVLSVAMTISLLLMAMITVLYTAQHQGTILGVAFLAMPTFWILMGTLAYAASGGLCILIETAGGSDTIDEWPDRDWKEWAGSLVFVVFQREHHLQVALHKELLCHVHAAHGHVQGHRDELVA